MAILRSQDGKFYELPDELLEKYEMAEAKVKAFGGSEREQPEQQAEQAQQIGQQLTLPAGNGEITINLNLGGSPPQSQWMPPPAVAQQGQEQKQGDVQGHAWVIYSNRYWAYRNQYWAYRNHY